MNEYARMAIGSHGGVSYRTDDQMRTGRRNIAQTHGLGGYVDQSPDPICRFRARWGCVPGTLTVGSFRCISHNNYGIDGCIKDQDHMHPCIGITAVHECRSIIYLQTGRSRSL